MEGKTVIYLPFALVAIAGIAGKKKQELYLLMNAGYVSMEAIYTALVIL